MITEEKIQEVKKQLRNGVPVGEIKASLSREGYSREDIDKCFGTHKYDMRSWYLVFSIIFFIIGFCCAIQYGSFLLLIASAVMYTQYYVANKKSNELE